MRTKRLFLIICLISILILSSSCGRKATDESDYGGFMVKLGQYGSTVTMLTTMMYDPITKVVYIKIDDGLSPYYTIKHGEPVVAIYGKNWTEDMMK